MTLSPRSSRKSVLSTTRIARFISLARSHISCPVFFLAGLHGFAYSHEGVRQLSRGCMGGDLASSDPGNGLGTSRWSRQTVKERSGPEGLASPCWVTRWSEQYRRYSTRSIPPVMYFSLGVKKPAQWRAVDQIGMGRRNNFRDGSSSACRKYT